MGKIGKLEKVITNGKKAAIGAGILAASIFGGKNLTAQEVYTANYWVSPNDSTLIFRGSFDLDGDNERTQNDADIGRAYLDGNYTPSQENARFTQKFDVNKNGIPDEEDLSKYVQYLEETPFFQPPWYWNKLQTSEERDEFLEKEAALNSVSELPPIPTPPIWDCTQYAQQTMIDMHGFGDPFEIEQLKKVYDYNFEDNGLGGNFPLINVVVADFNQNDIPIGSHEMNTVLTGDNALEWGSWNHFEPQTDQTNIQPGEAYLIGDNAQFVIRGTPILEGTDVLFMKEYLKYIIKNQEILSVETLSPWNLNQILQRDKTDPQISTSLQEGESYNAGSSATINVSDEYFKRAWYSIDGGETKISLSNGANSIILPSNEGDFNYIIYAGDDFYNEVLETRNINIEGASEDNTPPIINWTSEVSGTHSNNIAFDWNISDPNFRSAWISKNGEKQDISQTGEIEFNDLPNGQYVFWMGADDFYDNADSAKKEFQITGVGLEDKLFGEEFKIYPNPSVDGLFKTKFKLNENQKIYGEVFDSSGRLIYSDSQESFAGENEMLIDLTNVSPGMYFYHMRDSDGNKRTEKIIRQ